MKILTLVLSLGLLLATLACAAPVPTPIPTPTPVPTATPNIPATVTARVAAIPTATPYPTLTPWPTATPRPTLTPWPTHTPYPTVTPDIRYEIVTPTPEPTLGPLANWVTHSFRSVSISLPFEFTGGSISEEPYGYWFTEYTAANTPHPSFSWRVLSIANLTLTCTVCLTFGPTLPATVTLLWRFCASNK